MVAEYKDLTGQRFGRLVCIRHFIKDHMSWWVCKCDCGKEHTTRANALKRGMVRSCGCLQRDWGKSGRSNKSHGITNHPLYRVYHSMKDRCYRPNDAEYHNYGGRGITMCDEWKNDVGAFYNWAIAHGYKKGLSIDRINPNGNYCPENCRWADWVTQGNNKRTCHYMTLNNETHTMTEWAKILNIPLTMLKSRIRRGWPTEKCLLAPRQRKIKGLQDG